MKIKDEVWEKCTHCDSRLKRTQEETYGCDTCKKPIRNLAYDSTKTHNDYLDFTVFSTDNNTTRYEFCTWKCALKKLKTIKTDYFINLPLLHCDDAAKGQGFKDFLKLLK
jgi:hypothetical protein